VWGYLAARVMIAEIRSWWKILLTLFYAICILRVNWSEDGILIRLAKDKLVSV